jgi:hypothetical protein
MRSGLIKISIIPQALKEMCKGVEAPVDREKTVEVEPLVEEKLH